MKYEFMPLSPIHIGNGTEIYPYEYVIQNEMLYKINFAEIINKIPNNDKLVKLMMKDIVKLRQEINKHYEPKFGYIKKMPVSYSVAKLYKEKLAYTARRNENNQLILLAFIDSLEREYIPGSTIKGALRGALLSQIAYEEDDLDYTLIKTPKGAIKGVSPFLKAQNLEKNYLEYRDVKEDPFKALKITDARGELVVGGYQATMYVYKPKRTTFEPAIPIQMVCADGFLQNNNVNCMYGNLSINEDYFNHKMAKGIAFNSKQLIKSVNEKASKMIDVELEFFRRVNYGDTLEVYTQIKSYFDNMDKNTQMLVRLGRGAGMNSTTFNLVNKGRELKTDPRSRLLVENKYPLGWGVISFVE
ncbi:MAG: type III-A CRISPR-associated RAMP protein Csm5 [Epulopiscium sp. Nele67-Bin005]|nr:MAG: type III-A CRISPR-associated RAMP protein Csm5 [Epulopiscium sp. Nele67-Bin005]